MAAFDIRPLEEIADAIRTGDQQVLIAIAVPVDHVGIGIGNVLVDQVAITDKSRLAAVPDVAVQDGVALGVDQVGVRPGPNR